MKRKLAPIRRLESYGQDDEEGSEAGSQWTVGSPTSVIASKL
jgi:hypothetical protein